MYVVTFYSFKGGVGRTLALANVGVDLAQRGYRVLLVDFDLEAPGLDTISLSRPPKAVPGLVEYVLEYLREAQPPAVEDYLYQVSGVGGGSLWVMPAGSDDDGYSKRLGQIDWGKLYDLHDGYLMFEDLKLQWERVVAPDYVLIDSRTGHTDVGGICTRQLPDAVVALFFPNDQNLRGLRKVVTDIRSERQRTGKDIELHFVMSNVPDIEDEEGVLAREVRMFRQALGIGGSFSTVHRYDSLALLQQLVFVKERPSSRLSREYQSLTDEIMARNPADRAGALAFLESLTSRGARVGRQIETIEDQIGRIREEHAGDHEVLLGIARYRMRLRQIEEALVALDEADASASKNADLLPETYMRRAECRQLVGDRPGAADDANRVLTNSRSRWPEIGRSIRLLRELAPIELKSLAERPAVNQLAPAFQLELASELSWNRDELDTAQRLVRSVLEDSDLPKQLEPAAKHVLSLILIGLRAFEEAVDLLEALRTGHLSEISWTFNLAVALWGRDGIVSSDLMRAVLQLHDAAEKTRQDANYFQCLAVAAAAVGEREEAGLYVRKARTAIAARPVPTLSCWTYCTTGPTSFQQHLDALEDGLDTGRIAPEVVQRAVDLTR